MALEYKSPLNIESIMHVLDEHVVWYGKIVKGYFEKKPFNEGLPESFREWIFEAKNSNIVDGRMAEKLSGIYGGLTDAANIFVTKCNLSEHPPLKEYNELTKYYEEFIQAMRRIERDRAVENSGFDERTGLRSVHMMKDDVDLEMQRRARQGSPFAVALLKINDFHDVWRQDSQLCLPIIHRISAQIRECLRAFDDAYYLGDEYFLLSLKHADMIGAESAMARLNKAIKSVHIAMPEDPLMEVTVSAVVFEPSPADKLDVLLDNMKKDLQGIQQKATVVKYNDVSPLQRHVQEISKRNT